MRSYINGFKTPSPQREQEGVTTWVVDEKIAVYYQKNDDTFAKAVANVDAVTSGSATLTDAKNCTEVKFVYPSTLANTTGGINTATLLAQHDTIADNAGAAPR